MEYVVKKKYISHFLLILILSNINCTGQPGQKNVSAKLKKESSSIDTIIKGIRREYVKINSDSSKYRITKEDISGQSAEGGEVQKFYLGQTLKKLIATFFGETGKVTSEYYFKGDKVIFVFEREDRYESPIDFGKSKIKSTLNNRYYFTDDKLILWIDGNGKIVSPKEYSVKESETLEDLKEWLKK